MHHLDNWIKIDQLDVTCFIISLFTAHRVSNVSTSTFRSLRLTVFYVYFIYLYFMYIYIFYFIYFIYLYFMYILYIYFIYFYIFIYFMYMFSCIFTETRLLKQPHTWRPYHSPLNKDANAKTSILTAQYNTWNKSTISPKLLRMDILTFETCWAVNSEIIKQVTPS